MSRLRWEWWIAAALWCLHVAIQCLDPVFSGGCGPEFCGKPIVNGVASAPADDSLAPTWALALTLIVLFSAGVLMLFALVQSKSRRWGNSTTQLTQHWNEALALSMHGPPEST